jgi:integrase
MTMGIIRPLPRLPGPFVFPVRGGDKPVSSSNLDRGRDRAQKLAGVAHWTPHDLRRTASTLLQRFGASDELVDRILNHALPGQRGSYNLYAYLSEKRAALELLSEHVAKITARNP